MEVGVLGPAELHLDGVPVDIGTRKQRALLAALALHRGRPVSVDALVDLLWPEQPPPGVSGTLQAYVAGLRRALEPERAARAPASVLVTVAPGYALRMPDDCLDSGRFEKAVSDAHHRLGPISRLGALELVTREELETIAAGLEAALGLWRGMPFAELEDAPAAVAERARLEELRLVALEDRAIAALALGRHDTVVPELEALTTANPLRERLWALRAVALVRAGRQAEALDVLRRVREVLDEELGIEPSHTLRELQTAVLRQDASLEWHPPPATSRPEPAAPGSGPRATAPLGAAADAGPAAPVSPVAPWPMVGRDAELAALAALLEAAEGGAAQFAALVGEPGIGKSRLAAEFAALARARGHAVVVARCSQDDGAPPLWPWASLLRGLGRDLAELEDDRPDEGAQFRTWEAVVGAVAEASSERPLVLGLDDLHWADPASLRVLRLLLETAEASRLVVVATWRAHPEPVGALAEVAEAFARRHALRLDLRGLDVDQAAAVVSAVAHSDPSRADADALRRRTDGNPFFLVEYARLAAERGDLAGLLSEPHPPSAVHDVVLRRLERLPEATLGVLRTAAVVGREFDLDTVVGVSDLTEEGVLDALDVASEAGLVRESAVDTFRFAHALVRDTVYAGLSVSRRARLHARVAESLQRSPGRESERARHWLAAGPAYASRAWLAAVAAATVARRLHAYEQSEDLLRSALATMSSDPDATLRDRYDILMQLTDALRWMGMWVELTETVIEAVDVAERIGDVELVAQAAVATTVGALWQSAPHGQVQHQVVAALRRSLDALPPEDGALRCRVMLGLANELYYGSTFEERRALVDEALAMARRLGDDALLLDACQIAFVSLWASHTAPERLSYVEEAVDLARRLGLERAFVVSATLLTVVLGELGRVDEMRQMGMTARQEAERLRLPYGLIVLDTLELPWLAMEGRFEECERLLADVRGLDEQMSLEQTEEATASALLSLRLWQGRPGEMAPVLASFEDSHLPVTAPVLVWYLRAGQVDAAREHLARHPVDLDHDDWFSMLSWCCAAEAGLELGERDLAAAAYGRIAPFAGCACTAGSGLAMGPVDAFLALGAAAVGETELAAAHADRALELMEKWQIPLAAQWLRDQRDRHGF